jgi:hypothetical protein
MLMLALIGVPSVGAGALQRPHCVQHEAYVVHAEHRPGNQHTSPAHESAAWSTRTSHQCTHCPASECVRLSPCSGATSTAVSAAAASLPGLSTSRVGVQAAGDRADSALPPTDTPPPQPIA